VPDCPNLSPLLECLAQVTDLPVATRAIETDAEAVRFGMAGSPTLLVDGIDPFAAAGDCECVVSCRLYQDDAGRIASAPTVEQLRAAISRDRPPATEVLSAWRIGALPLDAVERATHQTILRAFAITGCPPAPHDLDRVAAGNADQVLRALHDVDAIRLTSYGEIALAYPFSAASTRHRVRIGGQVDVYAMCAVDALGIAPMLRQDTVIESIDVTTGESISVVTRNGRSTWVPAEAVVFIGADASGGASADCCCDYLNFFADRSSAQAWIAEHAAKPGQIINQSDAEALAIRLFGDLLA
jgi:hypothetical protein